MTKTALSAAVTLFMLSECTTDKANWTKQESTSSSLSNAKSLVARINKNPFVLFSAHRAFLRGLTHNNIPPFIIDNWFERLLIRILQVAYNVK